MGAFIDADFENGQATITAKAFRNKKKIDSIEIDRTGRLPFNVEIKPRDTISIVGTCTGTAKVTFSFATVPSTPITYQAGNINDNFLVKKASAV